MGEHWLPRGFSEVSDKEFGAFVPLALDELGRRYFGISEKIPQDKDWAWDIENSACT